ncbi:hypothetical protein ACC703_12895 [Rhizobium ruizarguesonis]|jgi:hypothetical protein
MVIKFIEDLSRLKRLVVDIERLRAGSITTPSLVSSPVLGQWVPNFRAVSCVEGTIEGHPSHQDGARIKTSQLFAIARDDDESFIRTLNGWYRLGSEGIR